MRVKAGARHGKIVKTARAFAVVVQPDAHTAVGEPGEQPAARQTLQIDHPIELHSPHLPDAGQQFVPMPGRRPASALEKNDAAEVRVRLQQRAKRRINPPMDFALGKMKFEQAQHRQRLDHVAERTRFENEDFQSEVQLRRDPAGHD